MDLVVILGFTVAAILVVIGIYFIVKAAASEQPTEYVDPDEPIPELDVCEDILADCTEETVFVPIDECDHQ